MKNKILDQKLNIRIFLIDNSMKEVIHQFVKNSSTVDTGDWKSMITFEKVFRKLKSKGFLEKDFFGISKFFQNLLGRKNKNNPIMFFSDNLKDVEKVLKTKIKLKNFKGSILKFIERKFSSEELQELWKNKLLKSEANFIDELYKNNHKSNLEFVMKELCDMSSGDFSQDNEIELKKEVWLLFYKFSNLENPKKYKKEFLDSILSIITSQIENSSLVIPILQFLFVFSESKKLWISNEELFNVFSEFLYALEATEIEVKREYIKLSKIFVLAIERFRGRLYNLEQMAIFFNILNWYKKDNNTSNIDVINYLDIENIFYQYYLSRENFLREQITKNSKNLSKKEIEYYSRVLEKAKEEVETQIEVDSMDDDSDFSTQFWFWEIWEDLSIEKTGKKKNKKKVEEGKSDLINNISPENLKNYLSRFIIGQEEAIEKMVNIYSINEKGLNFKNTAGSFLFVGNTGVGKTYLAKKFSEQVCWESLLIDMGQFKEKHDVSKLFGAPPGYIGYGDGIISKYFKEKWNQKYHLMIFDEIEKAHYEVLDVLLNFLEEGVFRPANWGSNKISTEISLENTFIVLTTNIGNGKVNEEKIGFDTGNKNINKQDWKTELDKTLRKELIGRIDEIVVFNEVNDKMKEEILDIELQKISIQLQNTKGYQLKEGTKEDLKKRLSEFSSGRDIRNFLQKEMLSFVEEIKNK